MAKLIIVFLLLAIASLEGTKMHMPSFVTAGDKIQIECEWDLDKGNVEHIQWYKDNQLFYTYVSKSESPVTKVDLPGVPVEIEDSRPERLIINTATDLAAGLYTCELKIEGGLARMSGTVTVFPAKEINAL